MEGDCSLIHFETVKEAMANAGVILTSKTVTSILYWRDSYSSKIEYGKFRPWQVVNRIPFSNVLCLKVQLSIILRDAQNKFPAHFDFVPATFILPDELEQFNQEVEQVNSQFQSHSKPNFENPQIPKKSRKLKHSQHSLNYSITAPSIQSNETNLILPSCSHNNSLLSTSSGSDDDDIATSSQSLFIIKPSNGSLGLGIRFLHLGDVIDESHFHFEFFNKEKEKEYQDKIASSSSNELLNNLNDDDTTADPLNLCTNVTQISTKISSVDISKRPRMQNTTYVAQRYIRSHLIDDTKFDLRIYVLVSSVTPFEIYIYRNGLCRFCSFKSNVNSRLARITNVSMNKNRFKNQPPEQISRLISDVFDEHFTEEQRNRIWAEIDDLVLMTLFASHRYLKTGSDTYLPNHLMNEPGTAESSNSTFSRCFQIFGFDILLHENDLKPYLIEINYRPSLKYLRNCERRMKVDMIKDAIRISAPHEKMQHFINSKKWTWSVPLWETEINNNRQIFEEGKQMKKRIVKESNYVRIWPMKKKQIEANPGKYQEYTHILDELDKLPVDPSLISI